MQYRSGGDTSQLICNICPRCILKCIDNVYDNLWDRLQLDGRAARGRAITVIEFYRYFQDAEWLIGIDGSFFSTL